MKMSIETFDLGAWGKFVSDPDQNYKTDAHAQLSLLAVYLANASQRLQFLAKYAFESAAAGKIASRKPRKPAKVQAKAKRTRKAA